MLKTGSRLFGLKPRKQTLDILKLLNINQDDADRILGGMMRLEGAYRSWYHFINKVLKLAKNPSEEKLIWYIIGVKLGIMSQQGLIAAMPHNKIMEKILKETVDSPEVQ